MMNSMAKLILALALLALFLAVPALAEAEEEPAEWTVMVYFCGSDLESRYSYASENIKEMTELYYPSSILPLLIESGDIELDEDLLRKPGKVNLLLQTGGSLEWHTPELLMDVDPSALQRWRYRMYGMDEDLESAIENRFELEESLPLASMADPQTLADYIRWGREKYPAQKYALVLWDHGDGARSGLIIDELFDTDIMYLYELKQALADGGTHFEIVVIDACLMANIETAWNIKDYANWMVASEEVVPGKGTAFGDWLQQLFCYPECDGEWLGRLICDTSCIKYANEADEQSKSILTWSVIDLSKVDALVDVTGRFFRELGDAMLKYPSIIITFLRSSFNGTKYGENQQGMLDFGSLVYSTDLALFSRRSLRNEAIQALTDAVVYCAHGSGRSEARGLTICYPAGFTDEQLDIYAKNFPIPDYLAYIDAVSDWTAPDSVYESVERLPNLDDIEGLKILFQNRVCADGMPAILVQTYQMPNVDEVYYNLYRLNEETGEVVRLGRTDCIHDFLSGDNPDMVYRASDPMHWPAIDGELICMNLIKSDWNTSSKLYNVPAMINSELCVLRCGRRLDYNYDSEMTTRTSEYEIYGVWQGFEEDGMLLNRSVQSLSEIVGQEYQLLYPIDGTDADGAAAYEYSAPLTMYRALDVEEIPLPAGTYYLEYEIVDQFMRKATLDRVEIRWDGENMSFPDGFAWENDTWTDFMDIRDK